MKYLSLFSGIGGFELGIQQAYEDYNRPNIRDRNKNIQKDLSDTEKQQDRATCIGFSEIDKYAIQIYEKQFPNHKNYGDITKIQSNSLPDFDLLVGGFPCQSFSIAGKRGGFEDTRGTLFFEIARIIGEKQPRLLLLENVKGLLSHDKGYTFFTIISTLNDLGYDIQWQVLNSKNFGVPQNRERVFIIGHLRGTSRPEVFPIGGGSEEIINKETKSVQANCLTATCYKGAGNDGMSLVVKTLKAQGLEPTEKGYESLDKSVIPVITPDRLNKRQNGRRFKENGDPSFTLTAQDRHGVLINKTIRTGGRGSLTKKHNWDTHLIDGKIRRLTPKECERLQGFPDDWTKSGIIENHGIVSTTMISDAQRYKTLGNAVTVNVIKEIINRIIK